MLAEQAPAKINLALHVTGRRADGYHGLESLVVFAGLADELTARPAPRDRLSVGGPFGAALAGEANLVARAVAAFRARWPALAPEGVEIRLEKNLPVAAGLGGGSADAAAALRLMAALATEPVPAAEIAALALTLGADVPACLDPRPALVGGIGEHATRLAGFPACHVVLANPMRPLATAQVFRRLERRGNPGLPPLPRPLGHAAMLGLWLADTRNDLEPPATALVPEIAPLRDALAARPGCVLARMSGSGATVFGLFGAAALAHQAAQDLRARWPGYWVAAAPVLGG